MSTPATPAEASADNPDWVWDAQSEMWKHRHEIGGTDSGSAPVGTTREEAERLVLRLTGAIVRFALAEDANPVMLSMLRQECDNRRADVINAILGEATND